MVWIGLILIVLTLVVFINASEKVKYGEFRDMSWWLVSFGIYQWGQALVLTAFWALFGIACLFWWSPNQAMRGYLLFHIVRAAVELFLLNHTTYRGLAPYLMPQSEKITDENRLQLYSLTQGIIIISGLLLLQYVPLR